MKTYNLFARMGDDDIQIRFLEDGTHESNKCNNDAEGWPVWYQMETNDPENLKLWLFLWLRRQFKLISMRPGGFQEIVKEMLDSLCVEFSTHRQKSLDELIEGGKNND